LCSHEVLSGVGPVLCPEKLNMFNIPDTTPDPDPDMATDIECSNDGSRLATFCKGPSNFRFYVWFHAVRCRVGATALEGPSRPRES